MLLEIRQIGTADAIRNLTEEDGHRRLSQSLEINAVRR